ncbi:hypothetical protein O3P69_001120 [Scylla paramamosain]|uniref:Vitelline membrane outer layer 1-like protein n=1 Tax=Scylla paramamosain TaxID=85552 RepID=A0AAW0URE7_SCYPA
MNRGSWTGVYSCDEGDFLNGYNLKSQPDQGPFTDDTAANALRMYCSQSSDYLESPGNEWGSWLEPSFCGSGMGVWPHDPRAGGPGAFSATTRLLMTSASSVAICSEAALCFAECGCVYIAPAVNKQHFYLSFP